MACKQMSLAGWSLGVCVYGCGWWVWCAVIIMSISEKQVKGEVRSIVWEGFLEKESRVLKSWRKRWCVVTPNYLFTFKEQQQYSAPTEAIALSLIRAIDRSDELTHRQFSFRIETAQDCFFVAAESNSEREKWMGSIGAAMLKLGRKG